MKFLIKIFSPILIVLSISLFLYVFYKSEFIHSGSNRNYYFVYYICSISLLTFSILTFFINKKAKEYLIIVITSLVFTLYFFEAYLTFKWGVVGYEYKKRTGNKYDTRTKIQVYEDLKKNNKNAKIIIPPTIYLKKKNLTLFPLSGISNSLTVYCNENGYFSIDKSDRYGFNNPDEEWESDEIEYLLVGDSFTHGACVNRPNDIASVIRKKSKKTVLNLGYGGNGPLIELATLREYLNKNVKKILWIYYPNDLPELNYEIKNKILINYLNDLNFSQNLKLRQKEIDQVANNFLFWSLDREKKNIRFFKLTEIRSKLNFYLPAKYKPNKPEPKQFKEFKKILNIANNLSKKNNSKLYFIYLPEYFEFIKKDYDKNDLIKIKNILKELNIPIIDISEEIFKKEKNPLNLFPFKKFGHYNEEGYIKIGNKIYELTKD